MTIATPFRGARPGLAGRRRTILLMVVAAAACAFVLFAGSARGATRTWNGGGATNNWNDVGNWVGGLIPGALDVATFDGTSAKNVIINASVSVLGIDIGATYTGTISQPAGSIVTVGATGFSQSGGTFSGGTSAINVNGPFTLGGGAFTATSGTLAVRGDFTHTAGGTFNAATGTVALTTLAATIDVNSSETFNNLTLTSGTKTIAAGDTLVAIGATSLTAGALNGATGTLAAQGSVSLAAGYGGGTATVLINGAGAQTLTGSTTNAAGSLPVLVIDKPSGTLSLAVTAGAFIRTTNNWTYLAGTIDPGTSTVVFAGTQTISGSHALHDVVFRSALTHTVAAGTILTVGGTLTLTDGTITTGTVAAQGDLSQASTFDGGSGTLLIDGTGAQLFTGSALLTAGTLPLLVIDKPAGTLTLAGIIRTASNWTYLAGTIDPGTSTVVFAGGTISGSHALNDVAFRATTTIAAGTTLTAIGATSLTAGALNGATGTLAAQGSVSLAAGYGGGTATVLINGAGAQTLTGSTTNAAGSLPVLVIDKPSGTLSLAVTAGAFIRTTNNWTYLAGTIDPGTSTVVFAGTQTISGSHALHDVVFRSALTHTVAAGTILTVGGTLTLTDGTITTGTVAAQGDLSQASTFDGGSGTLLIDGTGAQLFTGSALLTAGTLPLLVIDKPAGTLTLAGIIRTASNWTYLAGTIDPGTSTVVFAGGTISGSHALNDVAFRATTTIAAGTTLTAIGATSLTAGALNGATGTLAAQGSVSLAAGYGGGTATVLINGAGAQTLTGSTTNAAGSLPVLVIDKPSGTLSLAVTAGAFIRTTNNWTYLAGTIDPGTSTVVFAGTQTISGSHALHDVVFRSALTHTVAAGTILTVGGTLTLTDGTITTGTVAAQGDLSQASTFDGGSGTLLIDGTGAQLFTGSALLTAGTLPLLVIDKPAGTLTLAGIIRTASNWTYLAGTIDPGTSTVVFAGGTISGSHALNDVAFRATTTIAAGTTLTAIGATSLTAGALNGATGTLAAQGSVSLAAGYGGGTATVLINGAGAQTLTGSTTNAAGSLPVLVIDKPSGTLSLAVTAGAFIRTTNNWTYLAGTIDPGTSTVVFAGTQTVTAAGMAFYDLLVNGGTLTLASAVAVDHDLTIAAGNLTTSATSFAVIVGRNLAIAGTLIANASLISVAGDISKTGSFTEGTSTILMNGTAGQTISGTAWTMSGLTIDDPAGVNLATDVSVTGTLTLTTGSFAIGANTLTIANPIAGVPTNLSGGATSSLSIVGAAGGIVIPSSVIDLMDLTVDNASGASLAADLTVNGTLTLATGPIFTGVSTLVVAPGGNVTRTNGHVAGNLRKTVPVGSPVALDFEVGDATSYAPVAVTFDTVSVAGTLTASTTPGEHPDVANADIDPAQDVNRYWTLIDGGIAFDIYSATFTFVAADVDVGANPLIFVVAKEDATIWTLPSVGTRSPLSTQATGMTTFSHFALGEPETDLALTKDDGVTTVTAGDGVTYTYTMIVENAGPSDATGVVLTDTWPTGFSQGTITPTQGGCAPIVPGPDFSCALGPIASGASATVSVTFTVPADLAAGPQTNSAEVASDVLDPDPANDAASDTDAVVELAAIAVSKTDGLTSVVRGTGGHAYMIAITNNGPSDADSVELSDVVPAAMTAGVPSADLGGDCSASSGNSIVCGLPASLAVGATWTVTVPYGVDASAMTGSAVNTATVVSDENSIGQGASDATEVTGVADLALTKDDGVTTVTAGDGVTYTYTMIVENAGPSDATGVVLTDTWPTGFSQGTITPTQGGCAPIVPGPDFSCALGPIASGASATVSVTFTVPADLAAGPQTNSAEVASDVLDPDPANDAASDTDAVVELAATPTPNGSGVPETDSLAPGSIGLGGLLVTPAIVVLLVGLALLAAGIWEARRHRPPRRIREARRHRPHSRIREARRRPPGGHG